MSYIFVAVACLGLFFIARLHTQSTIKNLEHSLGEKHYLDEKPAPAPKPKSRDLLDSLEADPELDTVLRGRHSANNAASDHREDKAKYSSILENIIYFYSEFENASESDKWFEKSCYALREQNQRITALRDEVQKLLEQLEVNNLDQLIGLVSDVFKAYSRNQSDAVDYLSYYHTHRFGKQRNEVKAPLADLVQDNKRLIAGLDEFCTSVRTYLAELKHDETPVHLTDFTSLELLRKASEHINNAISEAEAEADAEQSTGASTEKAKPDVPILEIPKNSTATMATMATGTTGIHKADIPPKVDLWDSGIDGNSIAWDCNDADWRRFARKNGIR